MTPPEPAIPQLVEHVFRRHYARLVAGLTRIFGPAQLDLVEDVVQEALLRAMKTWPFQGVPEEPGAWLTVVARRLATDQIRHRAVARRCEEELQRWEEHAVGTQPPPPDVADDTLRMMFTCCHPSLPPEARVALTLKTLGGFGVSEIARALLTKPATIAQRLTRAKALLRDQQVDFEVPAAEELPVRVGSVLDVLYLMFNEGYRAHRGDDLVRADMVEEAVRLTGLLLEVTTGRQPEVHALLALMLLLGARLPARTDEFGEPLTLAMQDRARWDAKWLSCGFHHFGRAIDGTDVSAFHLEAAIASCHAAAADYDATDWPSILRHYDRLVARKPSAIVQLNRAVAVAKVDGARAGLAALEPLRDHPTLLSYSLLPATRAQLSWLDGDRQAAAEDYRAALALEVSTPERQFLERRLAACLAGEAAPRI